MSVSATAVLLGYGIDDEVGVFAKDERIHDVLVRMRTRVESHACDGSGHLLEEPGDYNDMVAFLGESLDVDRSEDGDSQLL